jgi:2-polyprenyl-6-hydroxyphenyl methylase/3-demethylubiquinone-9 3-methyltransferase
MATIMLTINANPAEISKFTTLAHQWWDPEGPCRPLHELNPLRLAFIQRYVALNGLSALDVGCGGGILTEALAQSGALATGIDMSAEVLQIAKLHALESELSIKYQETTVEAFAAEHPNAFNVVTCMEMLEHVPDPQSVVNACAQLCAQGG